MRTATKPHRGSSQESTQNDHRRMLTGLRILIVEDVGMVAMALKSLLEEIGCVVVGTPSRLREAEELIRREPLDGVLLDLNLGGVYSYPVVDLLRKRNIPFIIMSGYSAEQLRPDLAGVPQMQKPFDRPALEEMILTALGAGSEAGETTAPTPSGAQASDSNSVPMKTRGEIESAVCLGMSRFEQEYLGRGPRDVHAHLLGELLVVRLYGVLTAAEQHLVETCPVEQGRDLLKQVRTLLIETARLQIDSMIQVITGVKVRSMHHDISTATGEEIVVFTLNQAPSCRELKPR